MARGRQFAVRGFGVLALLLAGAAGGGCGAGKGLSSAARQPGGANACARTRPGVGAVAYTAAASNGKPERVRQGAQVVLAKLGASTVAYVADEDDGTIHVVDLGSMLELATFDAGGTPGQMMMTADNRLLVTLRDKARVQVFEPTESPTGAMVERCSIDTAAEPVGLAATPDDATLLVTSGWGHALTALDAGNLHRKFQADLPREPRSIVVSDDGAKAYVAHAVGSAMSVVDLRGDEHRARPIPLKGADELPKFRARKRMVQMAKNKRTGAEVEGNAAAEKRERTSCQGFALAKTVVPDGRVLAPQVLVESGDTREPTSGYGSADGQPSEVSDVAVIDQGSDSPFAASLVVRSTRTSPAANGPDCLLPRAAAVNPARGSLFVTCVGSDTLVEYDAASSEPHGSELRRWRVASGPTGVAIDWASGRAVVWSQYDRVLNVVTLGRGLEQELSASSEPVVRMAVSRRPARAETADLALGRRLFHASSDSRISSDGRACASCHPDGRDDTITWATPDGPRQTPVLAGRLDGTAPYAWSGTGEDVKTHLTHTFQRLRGQGLKGNELDSLVAYITQMAPPPAETATASADRSRLERGSQIFHSDEAACASCHGKNGASPDGLKHDVASRSSSDTQDDFDTPSLRFVGGSAPYFHDGRHASLRALLVASDGKMGRVSHLAPADLDALEAYVRSL